MSQPPPTTNISVPAVPPSGGDIGVIHATVAQIEPFGDTTFFEAMSLFADAAFAHRALGRSALLCDELKSMTQCRAAILGARQAGLPVHLGARLMEDNGRLHFGSEAACVLLTAQALGAASFSVFCEGDEPLPEDLAAELCRLATIPLILQGVPSPAPPKISERETGDLRHETLAVWESGYCVLDEGFEFSEPLRCSLDMSDIILECEYADSGVLCVAINSVDDAHSFSQNAHMSRLPTAFLSDNEEALEMALLLYSGCAIINSMCELPRDTLEALAAAYGAAVV